MSFKTNEIDNSFNIICKKCGGQGKLYVEIDYGLLSCSITCNDCDEFASIDL